MTKITLAIMLAYGGWKSLPIIQEAILSWNSPNVNIGELLRNPNRYEGKHITLSGRVSNSFNVLISGVELEDPSGRVWVLTDEAVPVEGTDYLVSGKFSQLTKIQNLNVLILENEGSSGFWSKVSGLVNALIS